MGRPERPLDPATGPIARFAAGLRELRHAAGSPSYRELARRCNYSVTTLSDAAGGRRLPTLEVTLAFVEACGGDTEEWRQAWWLASRRRRPAALPPPPLPRRRRYGARTIGLAFLTGALLGAGAAVALPRGNGTNG
ncbi:helix-turn-helix domain-containing protein [Streptomyces millisiae]|uniref:Helix-turn-helix transcriptional regulator n=1 Tax=Streptomyces millisiae TaxID=3075542 RepID=A0ABU2LT45_9ACTN|nr:helix-turn-helix transcriptional regulator [Streptomyces sp. DSM 44918]MDT0320233.1 helix-turn-helix transcriptional regulator [Streptomyces sp. DSM 44918]